MNGCVSLCVSLHDTTTRLKKRKSLLLWRPAREKSSLTICCYLYRNTTTASLPSTSPGIPFILSFSLSLKCRAQRAESEENERLHEKVNIWLLLTSHWPELHYLEKEAGKCILEMCRFGEQPAILCHIALWFSSYLCSFTWWLQEFCAALGLYMLLFT